MKTYSIRQMRAVLGQLDEILADEKEIFLARRGQPIARIIPVRPALDMPSHADLRAKTPRLTPRADLIRDDRDGR